MLYRTGKIVAVRDGSARVEFENAAACGGCAAGQGCGLGPLLALFRRAGHCYVKQATESSHAGDAGRGGRGGTQGDEFEQSGNFFEQK